MWQRLYTISILFLCLNSCKTNSPIPGVTDGLVAYFSFSNGVKDESGNNNTAQIHGATPSNDRYGNSLSAYSFDGYSSYIELSPNKFTTSEFTYAAWVKPSSIPLKNGVLTILDTGDYQGDQAMVLANTTVLGWGMWSYTIDRASFNFAYTGILPTDTSKWYHIIASRGEKVLNIYVNGVLSSSQNMTDKPFYSNNVRTLIGQRFDGTFTFNGIIDEVKIFNRALSDQEAKTLFEMP